MYNFKTLLAGIITATILSVMPAHAYVDEGTKVDGGTVSRLQQWVEAAMGQKAPNNPIVMASREKFELVMNAKGVHYADARAMYIPGMVILDNHEWEEDDIMQQSLLVHELVHHVQLFSKRKYACPDAREYEAYVIQNQWLAAHGERPFASNAWIEKMSRCEYSSS